MAYLLRPEEDNTFIVGDGPGLVHFKHKLWCSAVSVGVVSSNTASRLYFTGNTQPI